MNINAISSALKFKGKVVRYEVLNGGNINTTYKVTCKTSYGEEYYLLQRINKLVFKNPDRVMDNVLRITDYINNKEVEKSFNALEFNLSESGKPYVIDNDGDFWRARKYFDCVCFDITDNLSIIEEAGRAFGEFAFLLDGFPVNSLFESIPNFHNTIKRYDSFIKTVKEDWFTRLNECKNEADYLISRVEKSKLLEDGKQSGNLPLRVTHNDTKCNNVIFNKDTLKALAVIDLDTIMPGLIAYDFGDGARSICCTSLEDEKDLTKVSFDLVRFEAFTKGYLTRLKHILNSNEITSLIDGVFVMTYELALRFLEDYLKGDAYFKTRYEKQNLYRARCQIALCKDIELKYNDIKNIILKYSK